jgi:tetratricopeptide (TPR) repeat protein
MKYVPNLIPTNSKVTLDIDFKSSDKSKSTGTTWTVLSYIGAGLFLIGALGTIFPRFWVGVITLIIGLTLLPQGHKWIEEKLKFKFTWLIKSVFLAILLMTLVPISQNYTRHYEEIKAQENAERARLEAEEQQKRVESEKKEKERLDSLNYYNAKADEKIKANQFRSAIRYLNAALNFSTTRSDIVQKRADCFFNSNQISKAIDEYSSLINSTYNAGDNYYKRALCYQKANKRREAVSDLKHAIQLGNSRASKLHEQLNPLKRRIAYYVTRCCDGSTSSATGQGACSHHGGVCNWNDPVYEEYRDY